MPRYASATHRNDGKVEMIGRVFEILPKKVLNGKPLYYIIKNLKNGHTVQCTPKDYDALKDALTKIHDEQVCFVEDFEISIIRRLCDLLATSELLSKAKDEIRQAHKIKNIDSDTYRRDTLERAINLALEEML